MESLIKTFLALLFGLGCYAFVSIIPFFNLFSGVFGMLGFFAAGTYLLSRDF